MMLSSITKKISMALSGIFLSSFIVVHALGNSTAFWGKESFISYAERLHSLGVLIPVFETMLLTAFLVHLLFAFFTYLENLKARPERYHVSKTSGGRTLGSRTMPYTGLILLVFVLFHLRDFHFTDGSLPVSEVLRNNLQSTAMAFFYIVSFAALTIHISHGLWSIFQTLGLNHPKYDRLVKNSTLILSLAVGSLFVLIPLLVLFYDEFLL